jgi:hypothetical protein
VPVVSDRGFVAFFQAIIGQFFEIAAIYDSDASNVYLKLYLFDDLLAI